jgi:hypothetical protein
VTQFEILDLPKDCVGDERSLPKPVGTGEPQLGAGMRPLFAGEESLRGGHDESWMMPVAPIQLSLARVMGPPDCQRVGTTVARY